THITDAAGIPRQRKATNRFWFLSDLIYARLHEISPQYLASVSEGTDDRARCIDSRVLRTNKESNTQVGSQQSVHCYRAHTMAGIGDIHGYADVAQRETPIEGPFSFGVDGELVSMERYSSIPA